MGRPQASLRGRKAKGKKNAGLKGLLSSLGAGKSSARSRKPSKKGMLGIVATAGLGAAAMAKRRREANTDRAATYPPVKSAEAHTEDSTAEAHTEETTAEARAEESTADAHAEDPNSPAGYTDAETQRR
ncbi:MAG: hypothetical protein M3018_05775 [Actinomycetota bacterium]|nr:hypothetical protein [Actinomycetota bacterium]